ncbi:MAG: eukaryotic-like serine/threonine-protein kinase [Blastocatellia bacterium]|jgi:serine/threonine protein kinase|nr:eukaryotic-like serine/threonine-protein kinase [Blastocatellia bacterium]
MTELKLQQCRLDGRYDVVECLGRGSYAEIYVARDTAAAIGEPQTVVIKALNLLLQGVPDAELERTLIENFQNEAVALDRVRHPNIINRLGHGTAIDLAGVTFHYLVLEYLPGGDMGALCRHQPLALSRALFYLEQVCAGLAHAHECGVIHRDIKPQNLLLTADREIVKIADFGVAKLEASEGAITRVGTNIYAAPEHNPLVQTGPLDPSRLTETQQQLTPAADIFSLAKTTYTLLAGEAPRRFSHREISALPEAIAGQSWAASVLRVLQKATQSNPSARYQTVQDFWADLADAALPPTQPLNPRPDSDARRRPSASRSETATKAPPRPTFNTSQAFDLSKLQQSSVARPRIVVSMPQAKSEGQQPARQRQRAEEILAELPDDNPKEHRRAAGSRKAALAGRGMRALVAALIIILFAGMLIATNYYVSKRRALTTPQSGSDAASMVGREATTTTDVNLRPAPSVNNEAIGIAEQGSRVRVLSVSNNWYEVQVLEHGRVKIEPTSPDRGWIHKRFLDIN